MARSLPATVIEAINAQSSDVCFLILVEFTHSLISPIRVVNNTVDIMSGGVNYTAFPFSAVLPADSEERPAVARIVSSNVSLELIDELRTIAGNRERLAVVMTLIDARDPDTALRTVSNLEVSSVSYSSGTVEMELSADTFRGEGYPALSFTPNAFRGLV